MFWVVMQAKLFKKLPSIEVGLTALARPTTLTLIYDLDLQSLRAMFITYSHAKVQGQRSVGSEEKVESDGQTDKQTEAIALPAALMQPLINMRHLALVCSAANVA